MIKLDKHKHYRGDIVKVIGKALHSEILEEFVIYKHITGKRAKEQYYWVRPLDLLKCFLKKLKLVVKNCRGLNI